MQKIYYYLLGFFLLLSVSAKAQAPVACFTASSGQTFPITQCGGFVLTLNNCSTGTYDSAVWKEQIGSNFNCNGPWGIPFITTKGGVVNSHLGVGYSLAIYGSYRICLILYNRTTGQVDSTCQCVAIVYPIPSPNFSVSDSFGCGGLTTTFTPQIQSGTAPFGPVTWFFGDNTQQTIAIAGAITHTYACKNTNPPCYTITLSVTDAHGCSKVVSKPCLVTVPCKPHVTLSVTGGSACVSPTSITYQANGVGLFGNGIYSWWFPPGNTPPSAPTFGPSSSATTATEAYATTGCKNVIVAVKDSITGCTDTTTVNNAVCIQGITVTSLSSSVTNICCNQPFNITFNATSNPVSNPPCLISGTLIATPTGGGSSITLGTINSGTATAFAIPCVSSTAVTYNISFLNGTVTNLCNNCAQTYNGVAQVTVNPAPTAQINLAPPTLINYCSKGHQFCFNASTPSNNLPGCTYSWYLGSTSTTALGNTTSFCYTFPNFGTYKIFLKVCQNAANGGCCALDSITVSQTPPTGSFTISKSQGCDSVCTKFTVSPSTDSLYVYNFGDGTPIVTSTSDTIHHCYFSNLDTCFNVTIVHINHSQGGFVCVDTLRQKGAVKIGHKIIPSITMSPPVQCLIHKQACVYVYPNNPGLIPPTGASTSTCLTKACHWYFTKPGSPAPVVQSYVCDSPKVCFDDTGHYDAHYIIVNNTCPDTIMVPNAVTINGVVGDFNDSVRCSSGGTLTNFCVKIKAIIKVFPTPTNPLDSTHVTFIVNNGTCGTPTTYKFSVAPNGPEPSFTHCFCTNGNYTITMITSNPATGCPADTTVKTISVSSYVAQLDMNPLGANPNQCAPYNFCFTSANSVPAIPDKITWSFGDGTTSSIKAPCHNYANCGKYVVKLKISNNSGTCADSAQLPVSLHDIIPNIVATLPNPCNTCVKYTNNTIFCGGTAAQTVIHYYYSGTGPALPDVILNGNWTTYTDCLPIFPGSSATATITDSLGCSKTYTVYFPTMNGVANCLNGLIDTVICAGTTLNLSGCNSGFQVYTRKWTMSQGGCNPNGTALSTTNTFSNTFSTNGYYYINFHQSNSFCAADTCVRVHVQNPVASFTGRDTIPCPGSFDTLINTSTGAYNTLIVSMNDPAISFYQTFTYTRTLGGANNIPDTVLLPLGFPGDYQICWKILSSTGCLDSVCKTLHVAGPVGQLNCSNVYGCIGDTICCTLTTNSAGNPFVRFSDGTYQFLTHNSSGIYNFCHQYNSPGHQLVQAFIDDGQGCSYPLFDSVHIDGPIVNFSWTPYKKDFCGFGQVTMIDSSIASLYPIDTNSYKYIVYDSLGNVYAVYYQKNPTITISTPGKYTIKEVVKSTFGCSDTLLKPFINIWSYPTAQFLPLSDTICINQCINYTNTSINPDPVGGYQWLMNFPATTVNSTLANPQYCYTTPGTYYTMLIDSSIHGCINASIVHTIEVLPSITAAFTRSSDTACGKTAFIFYANASVPTTGLTMEWSFGDGTPHLGPGNFPNAGHLFTLPAGTKDTCYVVKLVVRNSSGCVDSVTHNFCISLAPTVGWSVTNKSSCSPLLTTFTDNSNSIEPLNNYYIDFGDGTTPYNSSVPPVNYTHNYTNSSHTTTAVYHPIYIIKTQFGCTDTITDSVLVYPIPLAQFVESNDSLCGNSGVVNFSSTSTPNSNVNYTWDFGDGTPVIGPGSISNPAHSYNLPNGLGTICYTAHLTITSPFGCVDSFTHNICISANPQPVLVLGAMSSCNPLTTTMKDSSTSLVQIVNYNLDFGDGSTPYNSPSAPNISHPYINLSHTALASYISNYTVTTAYGCSVSIADSFNVYPIPIACTIANDSVCPGVSTNIGCSQVAGLHYDWFAPVGSGIFNPSDTASNPSVAPINTTTYSLAVVNQWGCKDTNSVTLFVKSLVVPYAGRDTSICEGGSVNLYAQGGNTYAWYQLSNHSLISTAANFTFQPTQTNIYEAVIAGDCNTDSAQVNVNVFPRPSVAISPNTVQPIIAGQNLNLGTTTSGVGYLSWHPNTNINCDTCSNVTVSPDVNTTYTVVFTDAYGCLDSAEITIYVLCDKNNSIYVPNAFEPSAGAASSRNAYFYVQGTGIKELTYLRVYNRWGTQVFNAEHVPINKPEAGWDGTFQGTKVNIDVYMYQMQVECANGTMFPISGNVTIIK